MKMDGEALMVLLEWTIYGFSGDKKLGLPASQSKTSWLTGLFRSPRIRKKEPQHIPLSKCIKLVGMKEEKAWGNEVLNNKLSTALDTCFSGQTVAALAATEGCDTGHFDHRGPDCSAVLV